MTAYEMKRLLNKYDDDDLHDMTLFFEECGEFKMLTDYTVDKNFDLILTREV